MSQNKKILKVELISKQAEKFETILAVSPAEKENQNKGASILAAFARPQDGKVSIKVIMKPEK